MNGHQPESTAKSQMEDGLPLEDYGSFSAAQIVRKLPQLNTKQVEKLYRYEKAHKKRRRLLRHLEDRLGSAVRCCYGHRRTRRPTTRRGEAREEHENPDGDERTGGSATR